VLATKLAELLVRLVERRPQLLDVSR
jgi:hypothetical protein